MEEVDRILIQSLRDIGCQIDDSFKNVNELNVNTLFGCVCQCLQLITDNKQLPTRSPPNISRRFKVCGELAQLCQSNGYKGDIGYKTFLNDLVIDLCKIPTYHPAASFPHKSGFTPTNYCQKKTKNDDLLLTQSHFMHTNIVEQQSNGFDENPRRYIDHRE
ncbi:unnamed protein product [Rotaria sordida]|uniref:CCDC22 N-terminal domain-containing protein n=1 Tax=Rotaria sordida TaxID=392033 RepID=A0A819V2P5_9BILA|nr:unnamed protein product [Rotaria sordida]